MDELNSPRLTDEGAPIPESGSARAQRDAKDAYLKVDFSSVEPRYTKEEKEAIYQDNRAKLEADLWNENFEFQSMPYMVDLQLSNFCNMSCTMCYDGNNPPLKKMPEGLVEKAAQQILPTASIIIPFSGSEPLILTWELTRKLAIEYGIELDVVTNLQYLDEKKFAELEPHISAISFSIDSHMPDVYEAIRLRSKPDKVFRNLPVAAKLCKDAGIDVLVKAVFMTENAAWMDGTVAYMADHGVETVHILRYLHFVENRQFSDPLLHMSKEWIGWMREKIRAVAKEKKVRVIWDVEGHQIFDHREDPEPTRPTKLRDPWIWKLQHYLPGYCAQSVYRVKVAEDGQVYPCCVGDQGILSLGNLNKTDFEKIWNGPESRDLRRGMLTNDVPEFCKGCGFYYDRVPPESYLPFINSMNEEHAFHAATLDMELLGPDHMLRTKEAPELEWSAAEGKFDEYLIVLAMGGEDRDIHSFRVPKGTTKARIPDEIWSAMRENFGYWWTVWALNEKRPEKSHRAATIRCLTRQKDIRRVRGSSLKY